jgi:hypothetical protein
MVDQALGGIWSVDILHGGASLVIKDKSMYGPDGSGVNGIRVREGVLYFNNPSRGTFCSVPIDMETGEKRGNVRVIASDLPAEDDFEVDETRGIAYITNGPENNLLKLDIQTGEHTVLARGLPGPTSARWTNGGQCGSALYVSTTGGYPQWLNGNATVGGAIYKVDV